MPKDTAPDWLHILHACSLTVIEGEVPASAPSPVTAIRFVAGVDVEPTNTIAQARPSVLGEVDHQWQIQTSDRLDPSGSGEFIILPPGGGGASIGWVRVRDTNGVNLPSRIAAATGSPEFLSLSADGKYLFAVSEEDDEYWIVVRRLAT
ncbi:hypothetical protein [Streptomyces sp. NPDC088246]|uniref:hypothetical protein n=1 Tax=Streptomyces sp. NPDC088246 TaxID=3365842 RepID=UPI00380C4D68